MFSYSLGGCKNAKKLKLIVDETLWVILFYFFQTLNTENERFLEVYDDVLDVALEITQLKNNYNIT